MNNECYLAIEKFFKEDKLINEAKDVIDTATKFNKLEPHRAFIKNAKEMEEIYFRINCVKSILINEGLMQKKEKDKFGNIRFFDCGEV